VLERGPARYLEKRAVEQFKSALVPAWTESCLSGAAFYRRLDHLWLPFRCGSWSCASCGPEKAASVRAGIRRAVRDLGLVDMLTLTLQPGARGESPTESRVALLGLWNAFATRLRSVVLCARARPWRCGKTWQLKADRRACPACGCETWIPFLREYVAVPEDHEDGTAHLHVAVNVEGIVQLHAGDLGAVQAFLERS